VPIPDDVILRSLLRSLAKGPSFFSFTSDEDGPFPLKIPKIGTATQKVRFGSTSVDRFVLGRWILLHTFSPSVSQSVDPLFVSRAIDGPLYAMTK